MTTQNVKSTSATLAFVVSLATSTAFAQAQKIAWIDMQGVILKTEEGKAARAKIEKEAESKKKEMMKEQADLKKMDEEFQAQMSVLSDEAKMTKQKEFQAKFVNFQNSQMNLEKDIRAKEAKETQKIIENLQGLISEIAKKKNYDMVFEKGAGALLYANKVEDISEEVVSAYNSKFKPAKK
jgi:outer membrane protein